MVRLLKRNLYYLSIPVGVSLLSAMPVQAWEGNRGPCPDGFESRIYSFEDGKIGLEEALRVTIAINPNVCLQMVDTERSAGVELELSGEFDWVLSGELSYNHEEKELPESVKRREQDRRDDLTVLNGESCTAIPNQEQKVQELEAAIQADGGVPINADADFQELLRIIEKAIDQAGPEALPSLITQREITLQNELFETRETLEANRETCRETGNQLARLGEVPEIEETDTGRLDLRLSKLFRNGLTIEPFLEGSYEETQYQGKRNGFFEPVLDENGRQIVEFGVEREQFIDFGGTNQPPLYTFRIGFDVDIPLLRGRGRASAGAEEKAAQLDHQAAVALVRHSVAETVLATLEAFWDLLAAQQRVDYLKASAEDRGRITNGTEKLFKAEEVSEAELARARAGEADIRARLSAARRELISSQAALLEALGTDVASIRDMPSAESPFPPIPSDEDLNRLIANRELLAKSVERRDDLVAARTLVESGEVRAEAARLDLRPLLDLSAGTWATAVGEDELSEAVDRFVTPSFEVAMVFEKPFGNNERQGRSIQAAALAEQNRIRAADAQRGIHLAVVSTLHALREASDRLTQAEAAETDAQRVKDSQLRLYKEGQVDLIDSLSTEQQYLQTRLAKLEAQRELAMLLARLRFASGTLIADAGAPSVTYETVSTLPRSEGER